MAAREIVVDDLETGLIKYEGNWFTSTDARSGAGNFGPTYLNSLHGLGDGIGTVTFTFNGSAVQLQGSNDPRNNSGVIDPSWDCLIDGASIGPTNHFPFAENNWAFCDWRSNAPGALHTLTVNARSTGQPFWVDSIRYTPTPGIEPENPTVIAFQSDPAIKYGPDGWFMLGGTANATARQGAFADIEFVGTRISWWGFIPAEQARAATSGSYSIDGKPPVTFQLVGLPEGNVPTNYNQMFFQTPVLEPGPHRLRVTHQGSGQHTPLVLTHLLIQGGNITTPSPTDPSIFDVPSSSATPGKGPDEDTSSSKPNIGAIVGGVVGGVAFLAVLAVLAFFLLRRRRAKANQEKGDNGPVIDQGYPTYAPTQFVGTDPSLSPYYTSVPTQSTSHGHRPSESISTDQMTYNPPSSAGLSSPPGVYTKPAVPQPLRKGQMAEEESRHHRYNSSSENATIVTSSSRVIHHEDSGFRLGSIADDNVVEFPPTYTPS